MERNDWLLLLLLAYNVVVFCIYALDKLRAKKGWRRTPERTLLWLAVLMGGPGALCGIYVVRHKTRKPVFAVSVPILTVLQFALALWGGRKGWW